MSRQVVIHVATFVDTANVACNVNKKMLLNDGRQRDLVLQKETKVDQQV